jgi:hypothetical protein
MESEQSTAFIKYMNSLPPALRPVYTTEQPNQPILLYEGGLEITQEINQHPIYVQGHGKVEYIWFPYPCIKFKFSIQNTSNLVDYFNNYERVASLTLCDLSASVEIFIEKMSIGGSEKYNLSGRIQKPIVQGTEQDLAYIVFHLINFHDFEGHQTTLLKKESGELKISSNRVSFKVENWKITLDRLETIKDTIEQLQAQGGFGITHVGKIEKLDGQTFSGDEAEAFLEIFADFLSFARGFRVPLILLVGYDAQGEENWQHWGSSIGQSWRSVDSWFPTQEAGKLAEVLPGFLRWWEEWGESAKLALYSYLEANYSPTIEVTILLSQVTLELIARVLMVEKEKIFDEEDFDHRKHSASSKLRLLLGGFGIPLNLPPIKITLSNQLKLWLLTIGIPLNIRSDVTKLAAAPSIASLFKPQSPPLLKYLIQLASTHQWDDGIHVLTEIRNEITHAKKKYNLFFSAKFDAADLGLWYLELVLLAMFGYQGNYENRLLKVRQNGKTEAVPWSNR